VPASGNLLHNLVLFGRLLRRLGLDVNPGRMVDLVHALSFIELGRRSDFYHATRALLLQRREDLALFDQAFDLFWRRPRRRLESVEKAIRVERSRRPRVTPPPLPAAGRRAEQPPEPPAPESTPVLELTFTYSDRELLRRKDFAELTPEEIRAVERLMAELALELGERRTRRLVLSGSGVARSIDLRRTIRRNLRYGGEVLEWSERWPKWKPRPLVILADVSGSMERYSRLLLHFMFGLVAALAQPVEAFTFGTRLTRVSRQLRQREVDRALAAVARRVPDWSGGTRIGEALKSFNFYWARRVLGRGAVVLLISDGWDRGDVHLLAAEMARLSRSCYRLIWLNPLLGSPDYEPLTRGMQAALPHVDDFLPVHNLASLEQLATQLARLDAKRTPGHRAAGGRVKIG
jgi:hypothetical protein